MAGWFSSVYLWLASLFFAKKAEITVVGLQVSQPLIVGWSDALLNANLLSGIGKVDLRSCAWVGPGKRRSELEMRSSANRPPAFAIVMFRLSLPGLDTRVQWTEDIAPTVAFNLRTVRKGKVTIRYGMSQVSTLSWEGNGIPQGSARARKPFALPFAS